MIRKTLFLFIFLYASLKAVAQSPEICNNGIDDDGDGLIDCYDKDCNGNVSCKGFFIQQPVMSNCTYTPPGGNVFTLKKLWSSIDTIDTRNTTVTGDLDGDGVPEVVSHNTAKDGQLFVLDGITGLTKVVINAPKIRNFNDGAAIADVNGDGQGEIFIVSADSYMRSYDAQGNFLWITSKKVGIDKRPSIADFDGDGVPEVYVGNQVFNAISGDFIAQGNSSEGKQPFGPDEDAHPVAADVLPDAYCVACTGLELVCGNVVYSVDIPGASVQVASTVNFGGDGFTSVADFDGDDSLDVIVNSPKTGSINVYVWNPRSQAKIRPNFQTTGEGKGGRVNIGNYDSDANLEIGIAGSNNYFLLDNDMTPLWMHPISDGSSNITGSSAFDFDCNGDFEIVYRDEDSLYIFDGDGTVLASAPCISNTRTEVPVVVDVDGDGQANIVCSCGFPGGNKAPGLVVAWKSANNNWPPTRKVWNQNAYFTTNINDDLSIPKNQQNNANPNLPYRLNSFLNQMPLIDTMAQAVCYFNIPDATISIDSIVGSLCFDSLTVHVKICNDAEAKLLLKTPLSFYSNDPLLGGNLIQTSFTNQEVDTNSCVIDSFKVKTVFGLSKLYAYINDDGTNPLNAPNYKYLECDYTNNADFDSVITSPIVVVGPDVSICIADTTTFTSFSSGFQNPNYLWSNGETTSSITVYPPQINKTYSLTVSSNFCDISDTGVVSVYLVQAAFSANPISGFAPLKVKFDDLSINALTYFWDLGDTVHTSNLENPENTYMNQGIYQIKQIVTDINGCVDSITGFIEVLERATIYHPNTFTPDGNGLNDLFYFSTFNIEDIDVTIFDRWGNRIYSWQDIGGFWDGKINGKMAQQDTYVFLVKYTTNKNEYHAFTGRITLIR